MNAWLWGVAASAADPRFPWVIPIEVPGCSAPCSVAVPLPLEARGPDDPGDCSDLELVDPAGVAVPFACYPGPSASVAVSVEVVDRPAPWTWVVSAGDPFDVIEVPLPGDALVAAAVSDLSGAPLGEGRLWSVGGVAHDALVLTRPVRAARVELHPLVLPRDVVPPVRARLRATPTLAAPFLEIPATSSWDEGDHATVTSFDLPHALPSGLQVTLRVTPDVVARHVRLLDGPRGAPVGEGAVRRVALGGFPIEELTIETFAPIRSGTLVVEVDRSGGDPLRVASILVVGGPRALLVRDPVPGSWTLLGGGATGREPSDLQTAADRLARVLHPVAAGVGSWAPNQDYVPPEVADGLARAAVPLPASAHPAWNATVTGLGLSKIRLGRDVVAASRAELQDVRLLDAEDRQVPFLVRRSSVPEPLDVQWTTQERPGVTELEVTLPMEDGDLSVPLATIELTTEATRFSREVHVLQGRGTSRVILRASPWSARDAPGRLVLPIGMPVGDTLRVEIHHGDDGPLTGVAVSATREAWELVAVVPEGGATLVFGDPTLEAPTYDLALHGDALWGRAHAEATLGPREGRLRAPLGWGEQVALGVGLAALALGLAGLIVRLVRATPEPVATEDAP